jgi:hypothetical protein
MPGTDDRGAWLRDDALDDATRRLLAEFLVPRHGLDGHRYWPLHEVPALAENAE